MDYVHFTCQKTEVHRGWGWVTHDHTSSMYQSQNVEPLFQLSSPGFYPRHQTGSMPVCSVAVMSDSWRPHGPQPTRLFCPWDFPGKNTRVDCHFLLQGIFPTHGSKPGLLCLLHCRWILYPLSHLGSSSRLRHLSYSLLPRKSSSYSVLYSAHFC